MKFITYLTMPSILMQLTVIELIEGKIKNDNTDFHQTEKNVYQKPYGLYYHLEASNFKDTSPSTTEYLNVSLLQTTTDTSDLTTTVIDELYDENTSVASTTDSSYTTIEFENVTEISLFEKKNHTIVKPSITPKKTLPEDCSCNLLFRICDINCCCDRDCSDSDYKMFKCNEVTAMTINQNDMCYSNMPDIYSHFGNKLMDMFCIANTNLPEKRNINREKHDRIAIDRTYKWHSAETRRFPKTFERKPYMYGDHVWVLKNGSIKYMDLPIPVFNDYCTGRKPLKFLEEETIKCTVKLKDLEMFEILKASEEATLVSVMKNTTITHTLNCSTLHCTNWTIIVCEGAMCVNYNKSIHEPSCTDINCKNLSPEFDYIFYYHDSKIINATIKLHMLKDLSILPFMTQTINVRFVIANETTTNILRLSGNPGYLDGLPILVSYSKENHSEHFSSSTSSGKYIVHPENYNGMCRITPQSTNYLTFNTIKRIKCRFQYEKSIIMFNDTNACKNINNDILDFFGINKKRFVSPYGNPLNQNDKDWIPLLNDIQNKEPIYGEYNENGSKLHCYNMIIHSSYIFTFADIGENNKQKMKILSGNINLTNKNVTFNTEDISTVVTIDTMFIDETKPSLFEYAAGPHLNIRLPKDFFFPFPNNRTINVKFNVVSLVLTIFVLQQIK